MSMTLELETLLIRETVDIYIAKFISTWYDFIKNKIMDIFLQNKAWAIYLHFFMVIWSIVTIKWFCDQRNENSKWKYYITFIIEMIHFKFVYITFVRNFAFTSMILIYLSNHIAFIIKTKCSSNFRKNTLTTHSAKYGII